MYIHSVLYSLNSLFLDTCTHVSTNAYIQLHLHLQLHLYIISIVIYCYIICGCVYRYINIYIYIYKYLDIKIQQEIFLLMKPFLLSFSVRKRKEKESGRMSFIFILDYLGNNQRVQQICNCFAAAGDFITCCRLVTQRIQTWDSLTLRCDLGYVCNSQSLFFSISRKNIKNPKWKIVPLKKSSLGRTILPLYFVSR